MRKKKYQYKKTDYAVTINGNINNTTENTVYLKDEYIWINDKKVYFEVKKRNEVDEVLEGLPY